MNSDRGSSISYVVPAYNCAAYVEEAVDSIYAGNVEHGDEVIVVDDASTDDTAQVLQRLTKRYSDMRVMSHRFNKGSAAAGRNTGIDQSRNELIFCLDADNVLLPETVHPLKRHMFERDAQAAAFAEIHFFRGASRTVVNRWMFGPEIQLQDAFSTSVWPGPTGNYLFTRKSWLDAGRYNDDKYVGVLDSWIFAVRQLAAGTRMVTMPATHYLHRVGIESHYVIHSKRSNVSLTALALLVPFLHLFEEQDIEYILAPANRTTWFEHLEQRPLRLKGREQGKAGAALRAGLWRRLRAKFLPM
jgi:glycosyltransferase involved in cell wall biosynthesis